MYLKPLIPHANSPNKIKLQPAKDCTAVRSFFAPKIH